MNEPIFNVNQPYTIAIRQQWLPLGVTTCMVFNFKSSSFYHLFNPMTQKIPSKIGYFPQCGT